VCDLKLEFDQGRVVNVVTVAMEDGVGGWLYLAVQALNFQCRMGGERPPLKGGSARRFFGPASLVQVKAPRHLARSVCAFLEQCNDKAPMLEWGSELKSSAASRAGELENPEWIHKNPEDLGEMPKTPRVWAEGAGWELIAAELVDRGILVPIEEECIAQVRGGRVLGGLFGARKSGRGKGQGPRRLVMNIFPNSWLQETIEGDVGLLPTTDKWESLILRNGEVLLTSSEDLKCCFYVCRLPVVWHRYMALSKPVRRAALGLAGSGSVFVAAAVTPMGRVSATGIIQHIHRRQLREWVPGVEPLPVEQAHLRGAPHLLKDIGELSGCRLICHCRPDQVCIDNLDLLDVADEVALAVLQSAGPPEAVPLARARCDARGVPPCRDQSVSRSLKSQAFGEPVGGDLGMISPPKDFACKLVGLSLFSLDREKVAQRWLQVLAGRWVRAMMFRRKTMSAFDHPWRAVVRRKGERRLPSPVFREILIALGLLPFMRCDLRSPVSGVMTVSDASEQWGAVCRAVRLLPRRVAAARAARSKRGGRLQDEGVLSSLFGGIGGIRRALDMLGLSVAVYATSETDVEACRVARYAWPDMMELGDVQQLGEKGARRIRHRAPHARWVILGAGAPCVDLTRLGVDRRGLRGTRSGLFFEILLVQALVRRVFPAEVQLFNLADNVSSMGALDRHVMSQALGLQPVVIEAANILHARRERLCWCDWAHMTQWQGAVNESEEVRRVVIPGGAGDLKRWLRAGRHWCGAECEEQRLPTFVRCIPTACAGSKPKGLHQCSEEELARWRAHEYCYAPYQFRDVEMFTACAGVAVTWGLLIPLSGRC
ncbi:unnamed protein product, partial [Prorocentrum cordatum]